MSVRSGQSITTEFTTRNPSTSARVAADSLPTGTLYVNGTADGATVTVTSQTNGLYKAAVTLPTLAVGDVVSLVIVATVSGTTDQAKVWEDAKDVLLDASGKTTDSVQTGDSYAVVNSGTFGNAAIKGYVDDIGVAGAGLTALGDTRLAHLDADVTSRMATYTQPAGFLAATFPGTVASTTNITAGTITTVTTLTNLPTIPANWLTSAGIAANALNGKGDWNVGKTGYSLTQAFPANFAALGITAGGKVSGVVLVDTTTTNTDMRGTDGAALAGQIPADFTDATFAGAGVFSAGALANAPTGGGGGGDVNVVSINGTTFSGPYVPADVQTILGVASAGTAGYVGTDWGALVGQGTTQDLSNTTLSPNQTVTVSGVVSAQLADGVVHGGSTALLYLQQMNVQNPTGSPLVLYSSGAGSSAIDLLGGDGASAISAVAGAGGHDISLGGDGQIWDGVNGRPVQVLSDRVMLAGVLPDQSLGDAVTVILPAGPAANGVLIGSRLRITSGGGQYQERTITTWNGTTKAAGIDASLNGAAQSIGDSFQVLYDNAPQMDGAGNVYAVATVAFLTPAALAQFFTTDSTATYADAVAGSVVKEVAANAAGSAPTVVDIRAEMDANSTKLAHLDADVSSRSTYAGADTAGTTTLLSRVTGAVALATQIPAAFTDATFASAGVFSTGALANAPTGGGGGSDPWATAEPGTYSSGTFGYLVATDLPAILSKLNAAGSTVLIGGTVPDDAGVMRIVRGDGYYLSDGTQIGPFTNTSGLAFNAATSFKFRVFKGASQSSGLLTDSDVAVTGSSGAWSFTADLTESQTTLMTHDQHGWEMVVTLLNGHTRTLARGTLDLSD